MRMYESLGRCAELVLSHFGDGTHDPREGKEALETNQDAIISMCMVLDEISSDWGFDLVAELTKAREEAED